MKKHLIYILVLLLLSATCYADGWSDNDYTNEEKEKLANIEAGADANEPLVSQVDAEAGTSTTEYSWSPLRIAQAIAALASSASSFLGLTDTPDSYGGQAGKAIIVNVDEDGLEFATFADGANGEPVLIQVAGGYIQWKYESDVTWTNLIATVDLEGSDGTPGADGTEVTLQVADGYIQWSYVGSGSWTNLIATGTLIGATGPAGPQGAVGATGVAGVDGTNGYSVLSVPGVPGIGTGNDGDYCINTLTHDIYGPKIAGAWGSPTSLIGPQGIQGLQGETGPQGIQGETGLTGAVGLNGMDGNTILYGMIDPTTEGVNGDFYINTTANTIFGPKATTWPSGVSLVGPAGSDAAVDLNTLKYLVTNDFHNLGGTDATGPAETSATIEDIMTGADAVTTIADADTMSVVVGGVLKKITGANAKTEFGGGGFTSLIVDYGFGTVDIDTDGTIKHISGEAVDNPFVYFKELDGTEWWVGIDDIGNSLELRTSATVGTNVKLEIDEDGDIHASGLVYDQDGLLGDSNAVQTVSVPVYAPDFGTIPIWRAPSALNITAVHYFLMDGTEWVGQLQIGNTQAAANVDTQAADSTVAAGANVNVAAFAFGTVDINNYLSLHTSDVTGTPTRLNVQFEYNTDVTITDYYLDSDEDTYGDLNNHTEAVYAQTGYVTNSTDCDDTDNTIYPGATEVPDDSIDQDCDGYDTVSASLCGDIACTQGSAFSGGYSILMVNDPMSAGTLRRVKVNFNATCSTVQIYVLRTSGSNYIVVGSITGLTGVSGLNTYNLASPITVQAGDFLGVYSTSSGAVYTCTQTGASPVKYRSGTITGTTAISSWTNSIANNYLKMEGIGW